MAELSLTEHAVLGVLAEGPTHGFAIARELGAESDLGRIFTVRRPLVYRALDRLVEAGVAETVHVEPSDAGPNRVVHRVTRSGRRHLLRWLDEPVEHVRDLRLELMLKLALLARSGRSAGGLVSRQREALSPTLAALETAGSEDPVEMWRRHIARAADAYLAELADLVG
ncbi:MAG TPA: PadR family transcriptional regulator [Acidimicrobiia bacterium]|nr:PadR family transcriptional regulator [Acidimicrobiia bacterium]